eukprot:scaffold89524_cov21-Tisochrysis_lutea.AAC.2
MLSWSFISDALNGCLLHEDPSALGMAPTAGTCTLIRRHLRVYEMMLCVGLLVSTLVNWGLSHMDWGLSRLVEVGPVLLHCSADI